MLLKKNVARTTIDIYYSEVKYWFGGWSYMILPHKYEKILSLFDPIDYHIDLTISEHCRKGTIRAIILFFKIRNTSKTLHFLCEHAGYLRFSSYDVTQNGYKRIRSDTNIY